jgi:hypothetical protein
VLKRVVSCVTQFYTGIPAKGDKEGGDKLDYSQFDAVFEFRAKGG